MAHAHAELGERAEQRHLLGGDLAGGQERDRLGRRARPGWPGTRSQNVVERRRPSRPGRSWPWASRSSGVVARSAAASGVSASQPFGQAMPRFTGWSGVGVSPTAAPSTRWTSRPQPVEQNPQIEARSTWRGHPAGRDLAETERRRAARSRSDGECRAAPHRAHPRHAGGDRREEEEPTFDQLGADGERGWRWRAATPGPAGVVVLRREDEARRPTAAITPPRSPSGDACRQPSGATVRRAVLGCVRPWSRRSARSSGRSGADDAEQDATRVATMTRGSVRVAVDRGVAALLGQCGGGGDERSLRSRAMVATNRAAVIDHRHHQRPVDGVDARPSTPTPARPATASRDADRGGRGRQAPTATAAAPRPAAAGEDAEGDDLPAQPRVARARGRPATRAGAAEVEDRRAEGDAGR